MIAVLRKTLLFPVDNVTQINYLHMLKSAFIFYLKLNYFNLKKKDKILIFHSSDRDNGFIYVSLMWKLNK